MKALVKNHEHRSSRGHEALIAPITSESRYLDSYARLAFTLVEMLVVISIIGILAGLLLAVLPSVQEAKIRKRVTVEREGIVTAIESYKLKKGFYPPDNPAHSGWSPLYYELTGTDIPPAPNPIRTQAEQMGITNIVNVRTGSEEEEGKNFFQNIKQTQILNTNGVRFLGVQTRSADGADAALWNYDAHSPNRHNHESFDLWVDVKIGSKTNTLGNWKD